MNIVKNKKMLDILMLIIFFLCLGGMVIRGTLHELLGFLFIALVIYHTYINKYFFRGLSAGQWRRSGNYIWELFVIFGFGAAVLFLLISGLINAYDFIARLAPAANWRGIHLSSAMAAFAFLLFHLYAHARRYAKGKRSFAILFLLIILLSSGSFGLYYLDRWYQPVTFSDEQLTGERFKIRGSVAVVYFSWATNTTPSAGVDAVSGASLIRDKNSDELFGNAEIIALLAQDILSGPEKIPMIPLKTVTPYPPIYGEATAVAREEIAADARPQLKPYPSVKYYTNIVLVYPLWWGSVPNAVKTFLDENDLTWKRIIPIVTHGGGGEGDSVAEIRAHTKAAVVSPLTIYSSNVTHSRDDILNYLRSQDAE